MAFEVKGNDEVYSIRCLLHEQININEVVNRPSMERHLQGIPNGTLNFPDSFGTLLKGGLLLIVQREDRHTLHSFTGETAWNRQKDIVFNTIQSTHASGHGGNGSSVSEYSFCKICCRHPNSPTCDKERNV